MTNLLHRETTEGILKAFYKVYNELGFGFLEKVYENALFHELSKSGFYCEKQRQIKVYYDDHQVGVYYADIIVENQIILELKAAESLIKEHEFQLINYLKATDIEIGLLLNLGKNQNSEEKYLLMIEKI